MPRFLCMESGNTNYAFSMHEQYRSAQTQCNWELTFYIIHFLYFGSKE